MNADLLSYQYLWDGTSPQWGLMEVVSGDTPQYLVVNAETKMANIIEDNELAAKIFGKMLKTKVRVFFPNWKPKQ